MTDQSIRLLDLHQFAWARGHKDIKVLRHRDFVNDLWMLVREGKFQKYQEGQSWDVFGSAKYIISFIAERNRYAKFVGVWQVENKSERGNGRFIYRTTEMPGYGELRERLVVEWGEGMRSWAQWFHLAGNKPIIELLPPNYLMDFPGFYNFTLDHAQLAKMIANPDSNREWQRMLSAVSGVYAILHRQSGKLYVGSAYGKGGIWGRWETYARSPSGGNLLLKKLLQKNPDGYKTFQFAILRVLESGVTKDEVLAQEVLLKRKLGSRAFGLNSN